jgi:hypothetical protein
MVCSFVRFLAIALAVLTLAQASDVQAAKIVSAPKDVQDKLRVSSARLSNTIACTSEKDCKDASTPRCINWEVSGVQFAQCFPRVAEGYFCDDDGDCIGSNLKCMPQSSKCVVPEVKSKCCVAGGSASSSGTTDVPVTSSATLTGTPTGSGDVTTAASDGSSVATNGGVTTATRGGSNDTTTGHSDGSPGSNNATNASKGGGCVDERWLTARGYAPTDFVHSSRVVKDVLCPTGLALPCGTQHHAIVYAGKTMSYAELCSGGRVVCTTSRMAVNSLWSFHDHSQAGIEIDGARGTRLFMHDVRYSYAQQYALHSVMSAVRIVSGAIKGAMTGV